MKTRLQFATGLETTQVNAYGDVARRFTRQVEFCAGGDQARPAAGAKVMHEMIATARMNCDAICATDPSEVLWRNNGAWREGCAGRLLAASAMAIADRTKRLVDFKLHTFAKTDANDHTQAA